MAAIPADGLTRAGRKAVTAYRDVHQLQLRLDAARDKHIAAIQAMPVEDANAYFQATEAIRDGNIPVLTGRVLPRGTGPAIALPAGNGDGR